MSRWALRAAGCMLAALGMNAAAEESAPLRDLTDEDVAAWSRLYGTPLLSPDGKWLVYVWSAYERSDGGAHRGQPQLIVRATGSDTQRRYPLGPGFVASTMKMSSSGRWIAYPKSGATPHTTMISLMDLESGNSRELSEGMSVQFSADERWAAIQGNAGKEPNSGYSLSLHPTSGTDTVQSWQGVKEHRFDPKSRYLAIADRHALRLMDLESGRERLLESEPDVAYSVLRWSPRGRSLALLREHSGSLGIAVFSDLRNASREQVFDPAHWPGFPRGFEIDTQQTGTGVSTTMGPLMDEMLRWREAEDGLFFNLRPAVDEEGKVPDLLLWHWQDARGALQKEGGPPELYLAFLALPEGRFVRLADESLSNVLPQGRGSYALGFTVRPYGPINAISTSNNILSGVEKRDYALVDLRSGRAQPLERLRALNVYCAPYWPSFHAGESVVPFRTVPEPRLSPDGERLIYLDNDGNYQLHELKTGAQRSVTTGVPGWIAQEPSDIPQTKVRGSFPRMLGWTSDERQMLVSDGFDIWRLPLEAGTAVNLTVDGRRENKIFSYTHSMASRAGRHSLAGTELQVGDRIDLKQPVYFTQRAVNSTGNGLAVLMPGKSRTQTVAWQAEGEMAYHKAERAHVYVGMYSTSTSRDLFRLDERWKPSRRLTDLSPQRSQFQWPTPQLLRFKSPQGEERFATLYAPPGAVPGRAYPTIVNVYTFAGPETMYLEWNYNPGALFALYPWLRHGYALLLPDLPTTPDDPAFGALGRVTSAVEAAVATGIVDRERLGVFGHSFGGYETLYLITQTNLFKAAVSAAGIANLQSLYNSIFFKFLPGSAVLESDGQYGTLGPWWEKRAVYDRNSPIEHVTRIQTPLLMAHGDEDLNVPFSQSMEMFIALRRLQRPVALLQYSGADHGIDQHPDFVQRQQQFFDHYLKGAAAPGWWREGTSYFKGAAPKP